MNSSALIQRVWNFCNTLRDDGLGYGDYLEQLTYLLFLKMAAEAEALDSSANLAIPGAFSWASLLASPRTGVKLQYESTLSALGAEPGTLGAIFYRAENRIEDPAKLARLVRLIDSETWLALGVDAKGDLYEGLLEKNAEDVKSGAGQYFTPRTLIEAIIECVDPEPMKTIADPACGTGGFFLGAHKWLTREENVLSPSEQHFLEHETFFGNEIVPSTRRLCIMNLFLHGIGDMSGAPTIDRSDALASPPSRTYDYVFANPPFGKKGSVTYKGAENRDVGGELEIVREDFWVSTSNKQLSFLQHIAAMLGPSGRAAVVVPDNVLFEGGAGRHVRRELLHRFNVHTILRLPPGIFYAQGVRANVLFFDAVAESVGPATEGTWIYDLRSENHFTPKQSALGRDDLRDFVAAYGGRNRDDRTESERFRFFPFDTIQAQRGGSLDISWTSVRPEEQILAVDLQAQIIDHLEVALVAFRTAQTRMVSDGGSGAMGPSNRQ